MAMLYKYNTILIAIFQLSYLKYFMNKWRSADESDITYIYIVFYLGY